MAKKRKSARKKTRKKAKSAGKPMASRRSAPAPPQDELLLRLARGREMCASTHTAASKLVARARRTSGDASEIAKLAVAVLEVALKCSGRDFMGNGELYHLMRLVLSLGGFQGDAHSASTKGMAQAFTANWWEAKEGELIPTRAGSLAAKGLTPSSLPAAWRVPGLPCGLRDLALALEKHGNETTACKILAETGRSPADTVKKYPIWEDWIDAHIKRPRRGVYRLE